jgi:uncharacterized protein (DUF1697 family)
MTAYVLLLRGINVGGAGKLPMADLRALLSGLGCTSVKTYIQSGNAVFASDLPRDDLTIAIRDAIAAGHGFRPFAMLLTESELADALTGNPWPEAEGDSKPMHLFFHDNSAKADHAALDALLADGESWHLTDQVLYFRAINGIGRSKFAEKMGRHFKVEMTARNLNTCRELLRMVQALA